MSALRDRVDVDELLAGLRSTDSTARLIAAVALDDVASTPQIEEALRVAASDDDARVRRAAMHALACAHCKPDRCVGGVAVDVLLDGLLHEPSIRNRRWCAGVMMHGQVGNDERIVEAFRSVLASSGDRVLRERAAWFLASSDHPRAGRPYREWLAAWEARKRELLVV